MEKEEIEVRIESIQYILDNDLINEGARDEALTDILKLEKLLAPEDDKINPSHYPTGSFEFMKSCTVDKAQFIGYCRLTAMKYLIRLEAKDEPKVNALKAQYFINELVKALDA